MGTRRCAGCRGYFKEMWLVTPVEAYCSAECAYEKGTSRSQANSRRSKPDLSGVVRTEVIERDKVCQLCKTDRRPHVHHVRYRSEAPGEPWLHTPANLILVCQECHDLVHSDKDKYQPMLLDILSSKGYDVSHEQDAQAKEDGGTPPASS